MTKAELASVADLDLAAADEAAGLLRPSCASARWIGELVGGRPHGCLAALLAASDAAIAALSWSDIEEALAAHPRIGDRAAPRSGQPTPRSRQQTPRSGQPTPRSGQPTPRSDRPTPRSDRELAWSRQEQAATEDAGADVAAALRAGNVEYEERFGHVFLICATGRSAEEMLSALHGRLGHDPEAEREVVRGELLRIVRLRLAKTFR